MAPIMVKAQSRVLFGIARTTLSAIHISPAFPSADSNIITGSSHSACISCSMCKICSSIVNTQVVLHCDKYKLQCKEQRDNCYHDIFLLIFACAERHNHIRNTSKTDAVCNRVGQRHHDKRYKRRNCRTKVVHIHLCKALYHKHAYVNQCGSRCRRRYDARQRT